MTDVERWSIEQEYLGIDDAIERNIKIFYDYSRSHSYDEYVTLVRDEHADDAPLRDVVLEDKGERIEAICRDKVVGEIVKHDNDLMLVSFEGIGDGEYPVVSRYMDDGSLLESYRRFDKYVLDGDYLLDRDGENTIDRLYVRFIRSNYGIPDGR